MNGKIFDIQRFSIYDGPGIRTNVFFKGCNLRCLWCHNPESQRMENELMFQRDKCVGCGKCTEICKNTFTSDCTACGKCVEICSHGARKISGKEMSTEEVFDIVYRDREYYLTSGGGITLSGGEPLLQADFAAEILSLCKSNGINTCIETAVNVKQSEFQKVLPYLDTVLCDIKCMDEELHRRLTGVSNKLILENAEMLKASGINVTFRTPVIPGLNDCEIGKITDFCGKNKLELMAYHTTGCGKYTSLGREYSIPDITVPSREYMENLANKYGAIYNFTGI